MAQTWRDLLFAHWPVPDRTLRPLIPSGLHLETFDGTAWISIAPFVVTRLRPRSAPAIPGLSEFPEINVRTYVTAGGKPGVFFFTLDAGSTLAVIGARTLYFLPYFRARFTVDSTSSGIRYRSRRTQAGAPAAEFRATYRPVGEATVAPPGTLTAWLTERYCLYAVDRRERIHRAEIHHRPWALQPAEVEIDRNTMTTGLGFELPDVAPLVQFAAHLDVRVWAPERVDTTPTRNRPGRAVVRTRSGARLWSGSEPRA
jgi:uncharacterized protein YqjF (DUF2071 family)